MQLEQNFDVAMPIEQVWAAFHDPALLVQCLPGASLRGEPVNDELALMLKVKLGPIATAFAGKGTVTLDEAAHAGVFTGQATDGKSNSRVKGQAQFALEPKDPAATNVRVLVDFSMTGTLAQFSREGIVRALGDQLTKEFAQNLQTAISAPVDPAAQQVPAANDITPAETEAPALNVFTLIVAMLRSTWGKWTGRDEPKKRSPL